MGGNDGTLYTTAIVLRGKENDILKVNQFLDDSQIKVLYRKTSLVSLYITTEKPVE